MSRIEMEGGREGLGGGLWKGRMGRGRGKGQEGVKDWRRREDRGGDGEKVREGSKDW